MRTSASTSKAEFAYEEIRKRIIEGSYSPGYRLVLSQLAGAFGVSAFPVREAIRRLESDGLVKFEKNIGAQVLGISPDLFRDAMEITAVLEAYATASGAAYISASDLARAAELNDDMRALCGENFDPIRFTELNQEFHSLLCSACPNQETLLLLGRERDRLAAIRHSSFSFIPGRARQSVEEHAQILQLMSIDQPDVSIIEERARRHKLNTLQAFMERSARR